MNNTLRKDFFLFSLDAFKLQKLQPMRAIETKTLDEVRLKMLEKVDGEIGQTGEGRRSGKYKRTFCYFLLIFTNFFELFITFLSLRIIFTLKDSKIYES